MKPGGHARLVDPDLRRPVTKRHASYAGTSVRRFGTSRSLIDYRPLATPHLERSLPEPAQARAVKRRALRVAEQERDLLDAARLLEQTQRELAPQRFHEILKGHAKLGEAPLEGARARTERFRAIDEREAARAKPRVIS